MSFSMRRAGGGLHAQATPQSVYATAPVQRFVVAGAVAPAGREHTAPWRSSTHSVRVRLAGGGEWVDAKLWRGVLSRADASSGAPAALELSGLHAARITWIDLAGAYTLDRGCRSVLEVESMGGDGVLLNSIAYGRALSSAPTWLSRDEYVALHLQEQEEQHRQQAEVLLFQQRREEAIFMDALQHHEAQQQHAMHPALLPLHEQAQHPPADAFSRSKQQQKADRNATLACCGSLDMYYAAARVIAEHSRAVADAALAAMESSSPPAAQATGGAARGSARPQATRSSAHISAGGVKPAKLRVVDKHPAARASACAAANGLVAEDSGARGMIAATASPYSSWLNSTGLAGLAESAATAHVAARADAAAATELAHELALDCVHMLTATRYALLAGAAQEQERASSQEKERASAAELALDRAHLIAATRVANKSAVHDTELELAAQSDILGSAERASSLRRLGSAFPHLVQPYARVPPLRSMTSSAPERSAKGQAAAEASVRELLSGSGTAPRVFEKRATASAINTAHASDASAPTATATASDAATPPGLRAHGAVQQLQEQRPGTPKRKRSDFVEAAERGGAFSAGHKRAANAARLPVNDTRQGVYPSPHNPHSVL